MALYHSAKGSVNYTVVGSPTIVDGVVSGFSNSNYLMLGTSTFDSNKSFEFIVKAKLNSLDKIVFGFNQSWTNVFIAAPHCISWWLSSKTSGAAELNVIHAVSLQTSIWYYFLFSYDGNSTYSIGISTDGENFEKTSFTSTYKMGISSQIRFGQSFINNYQFDGQIDLNETYIKVNGQPWFGLCPVEVQKHQLKGPVGYTVVGSPTIVDGIASGFSSSDYLRTIYAPEDVTTFEFRTRFRLEVNNADASTILGKYASSQSTASILVRVSNRLGYYLVASDGSVISFGTYGLNVLRPYVWYYLKFIYSGTQYLADISTDGENWTRDFVTDNSKKIAGIPIAFGAAPIASQYFQGSIDLNNTYIKVNGKLWFYQPADTKYIVKDGKLVWADPRIAISGPVNYTVAGSPTIVDGIASGFSSSDYLRINSAISKDSELEISTKIITTSQTQQRFFELSGNNFTARLMAGTQGLKISIYGYDAEGNYLAPAGETTLSVNTTYYIKIIGNTEGVKVYLSTDDTNYNLEIDSKLLVTKNDAAYCRFGTVNTYPLLGSIDLNNTYIKVNGKLWFYGKNYSTQNIAPVPAGYPIGNTTTPAIGWVDMRTQTFTAAPSGATIGRDE